MCRKWLPPMLERIAVTGDHPDVEVGPGRATVPWQNVECPAMNIARAAIGIHVIAETGCCNECTGNED